MQNKVPKLQNINSFGSVITPLFLPSNGYRHHPLKVKLHHAPPTEDIMPKLSHTPPFRGTAGDLHEVGSWGRRKGKGGHYTCRTSWRGEFSAGSLQYEPYPCTCSVRLGPWYNHIYRQFSHPEHSRGEQKQTNTEKQGETRWQQEADHGTPENIQPKSLVLQMGRMRPREIKCLTKRHTIHGFQY